MHVGQKEQMMAKMKAEMQTKQEKIMARLEAKILVGASQEQMLASMDVFGEKLDKLNTTWKTCLENREAEINTGPEHRFGRKS